MTADFLLVNIGTPRTPQPQDVGIYLNEFLSDPGVIELPWILRWPLVHWLIVPKRKHQSAHAYQKIWRAHRSPLKVFSHSFFQKM